MKVPKAAQPPFPFPGRLKTDRFVFTSRSFALSLQEIAEKPFNMLRWWSFGVMFVISVLVGGAQNVLPSASPTMTVTAADGTESDETAYDGSAPMAAVFRAVPQDVGSYVPRYEWRFTRKGEETPFLIRYEENTDYTFNRSGSFAVELYISFVQGADTVEYVMDQPFTVSISESKLEVPNAFTPNGDGVNDVFRVKESYQSIVSFEAMVFNRWGKKLYEWRTPDGGWDGKSGGSDVPDGAYYLVINAHGADGKKYHIKKVINLLRGFKENTGGAQ